MYLEHFRLHSNPFSPTPAPGFIYQSAELSEALAHFRYALENREAFLLLSGEVGTGKTTAVQSVLRLLPEGTPVAVVTHTTLEPGELLEEIAIRFGIEDAEGKSKPGLLRRLEAFFEAQWQAQRQALLILDEAHLLSPAVLEEVRLLSNLEREGGKLVQICLVGQPELVGHIQRPELRQLRQRISVRYALRPLQEHETGEYLVHRLRFAGSPQPEGVFDPDAQAAVHAMSHGIPREINVLAGQALLNAFLDDSPRVLQAHVMSVLADYGFEGLQGEGLDAAPGPPPPTRLGEGALAPPLSIPLPPDHLRPAAREQVPPVASPRPAPPTAASPFLTPPPPAGLAPGAPEPPLLRPEAPRSPQAGEPPVPIVLPKPASAEPPPIRPPSPVAPPPPVPASPASVPRIPPVSREPEPVGSAPDAVSPPRESGGPVGTRETVSLNLPGGRGRRTSDGGSAKWVWIAFFAVLILVIIFFWWQGIPVPGRDSASTDARANPARIAVPAEANPADAVSTAIQLDEAPKDPAPGEAATSSPGEAATDLATDLATDEVTTGLPSAETSSDLPADEAGALIPAEIAEDDAPPPIRLSSDAAAYGPPFTAQIASFRSRTIAESVLGDVTRRTGLRGVVLPSPSGDNVWHRILLGHFSDETSATAALDPLFRDGTLSEVVLRRVPQASAAALGAGS